MSPRDQLRAVGLRCTPARERVLASLGQRGAPLTHAELSEGLPELDTITLYRTLDALVGAGLAHRVQGVDGAWRTCAHSADTRGCPANHAHFLCTRCGQMSCLLDQPMPRLAVPEGAQVQGRQLLGWGVCTECIKATGGA